MESNNNEQRTKNQEHILFLHPQLYIQMLKLLVTISCALLCYSGFASTPTDKGNHSAADSLLAELKKTKGIQHISTLNSLADFYMYSDGRKALYYAGKAYDEATGISNAKFQATGLILQGVAYGNLGLYDSSINASRKALQLINDISTSELGRLYSSLGISFEGASINDSALHYYYEAFRIYNNAGDDQGIVNTYLNLGCLFMRVKKFKDAEANLLKALDVSLNRKATKSLGSIYNNLGVVEDVNNEKQKALVYYSKALDFQRQQGNVLGMSNIYHNIAIIHFDLKEYDKAIANMEESLALKKKIGSMEGIASSYSNLAAVYLEMDKVGIAEDYVKKALKIASDGKYLVIETQCHKQLAQILDKQQRYRESSQEWAVALQFNDSLYNQSVSRQLSDLQAHYELKQKDQENLILRQREQQHKTNNRFLIFVIIVIAVIVVLLLKLLRMKILSMQKSRELYKLELNARNTQIQLKNKELNTLSANFISQNEILNQIKSELVKVRKHEGDSTSNNINELIAMVTSNLDTDLNWKKFRMSFEESYQGFFEKLINMLPDITIYEQKLCAFLFVGLSSGEIAQVMGISLAAVNKGRQRIRKRLQIPPNGDIASFLKNI